MSRRNYYCLVWGKGQEQTETHGTFCVHSLHFDEEFPALVPYLKFWPCRWNDKCAFHFKPTKQLSNILCCPINIFLVIKLQSDLYFLRLLKQLSECHQPMTELFLLLLRAFAMQGL